MDEHEMTYEESYEKHCKIIYQYILSKTQYDSHTVEDLTSETFIKLYLKWGEISPHTYGVVITWLYRAAEYEILDYIKKQSRRPQIDSEPPSEHEFSDHCSELEEIHGKHDYLILLRNIQNSLSPKDWDLFVAIYLDRLSIEEIKTRFNLNENALYLRKSRIKKKLKHFSKNFDKK